MDDILKKIALLGGKLKIANNEQRVMTFCGIDLKPEAISLVVDLNTVNAILFYCCKFSKVDLSILKNSKVDTISVLHGDFGNKELMQLNSLTGLRFFKYHDVEITIEKLDTLLIYNSKLSII